jgi:hypothetical protein
MFIERRRYTPAANASTEALVLLDGVRLLLLHLFDRLNLIPKGWSAKGFSAQRVNATRIFLFCKSG